MFKILSSGVADTSEMFINLGILLFTGLILSRLLSKIKVPHITGFLLGGILIGPSVLNFVSEDSLHSLASINLFSLGLIAFTIGSEFYWPKVKKLGVGIFIITIIQAFTTLMLVFGMLRLFGATPEMSLILAAIATATAPGPIVLISKQFKAKGRIKDVLISVVALDDAVSVILFGVAMTIVTTSLGGATGGVSVAFKEIGISILFGAVIGTVLGLIIRKYHSEELSLVAALTGIALGVGLAQAYHGSAIILLMVAGGVYTNFVNKETYEDTEHVLGVFMAPIMLLFYTLAGAELNLKVATTVGVFGAVYIVSRLIGKYVGAYAGAAIVKEDKNVRKYLGLGLLPQAGVAIGLSLVVSEQITDPVLGQAIVAIVLTSVVVFELIGPLSVKHAYQKCGAIHGNRKTKEAIHMERQDKYQFEVGGLSSVERRKHQSETGEVGVDTYNESKRKKDCEEKNAKTTKKSDK